MKSSPSVLILFGILMLLGCSGKHDTQETSDKDIHKKAKKIPTLVGNEEIDCNRLLYDLIFTSSYKSKERKLNYVLDEDDVTDTTILVRIISEVDVDPVTVDWIEIRYDRDKLHSETPDGISYDFTCNKKLLDQFRQHCWRTSNWYKGK